MADLATNISGYAGASASVATIATYAITLIGALGAIIATVLAFKSFNSTGRLTSKYETELTASTTATKEAGEPRDTYRILAKYSAQGLAQSRISFFVSISFAALGFIVILGGVGVALYSDKQTSIAAIPVIAGAIVDAVAALFFTVNARTQRVMVEFFDKLRSDQRIEDAMDIAAKLSDTNMASRLQALLALQFTNAENIPDLFRQLIESTPRSSTNT